MISAACLLGLVSLVIFIDVLSHSLRKSKALPGGGNHRHDEIVIDSVRNPYNEHQPKGLAKVNSVRWERSTDGKYTAHLDVTLGQDQFGRMSAPYVMFVGK